MFLLLGYEPGRVCNFEQVYMPCDPILADALFSCANNVLVIRFVFIAELLQRGIALLVIPSVQKVFLSVLVHILLIWKGQVSDRFACSTNPVWRCTSCFG